MAILTVPVLEGHGIRLRPFDVGDTAAVIAAGTDPLIPWITTVAPDGDHAAALQYVERQHAKAREGQGYSFAIASLDTDEALGQIGLWPHGLHRRWWIGYWLAPAFRRRGIATRALTTATEFAFGVEDAVRVQLFIEPWNAGSRRTAVNVGYRCEGLLRDHHIIHGQPRDMLCYARTGSDVDAPETGATSELVITDCAPADAAELLVLQRCCWVAEAIANDTLDIPPLHETLDDVRAWIKSWTVLVVRDGERLVGAVRGRIAGDTWEIGRLMVAPDMAGRGLGRRLLEQIERVAPTGTAVRR